MKAFQSELRKLYVPKAVNKILTCLLLLFPILCFYFCQTDFLKRNREILLLQPQEIQATIVIDILIYFPIMMLFLMPCLFFLVGKLYPNDFSFQMQEILHPSVWGMKNAAQHKWLITLFATLGYGIYYVALLALLLVLSYGLPDSSMNYQALYTLVIPAKLEGLSLSYGALYIRAALSFLSGIAIHGSLMFFLSCILKSYPISFLISYGLLFLNVVLSLSNDPISFLPFVTATSTAFLNTAFFSFCYLILSQLLLIGSALCFYYQKRTS